VESKRCAGGKIVQRQVLYLGEINDGQLQSWSRVIKAFDEGTQRSTQLALFPADRAVPQHAQSYGVAVRLEAMELHRPRQWGACWLAVTLYEQLGLDRLWAERLPASREGTRCDVVATLVCYRLIDPGSEWRLHRLWFERSAMADLLGADFGLVEKNALYRCLDKVLEHKAALFAHLRQCWQDLFAARFEVLLYDLTSTYFESAPPAGDADNYTLNRKKLRDVRRREGRYLLRTNLCGRQPAAMWQFYIQLAEVEAVFKNLKDDLRLRPIFHRLERRIEAHIFVAFMAYCLHVTLRARLKPLAGGLTPRAVLDKFADIQMLDVHFPTTDARTLILSRYTELKADQKILVRQLNLTLPPQPPPRIIATGHIAAAPTPRNVVETF